MTLASSLLTYLTKLLMLFSIPPPALSVRHCAEIVRRLQHLFVLLCLLQLHVFALTTIIRLIYSVTVQMHSGYYCRSIQQLLEKGPPLPSTPLSEASKFRK